VLRIEDNQNELKKGESWRRCGQKRLRKDQRNDNIVDIEMKTTGSLEEYRREK
jgi:hypothetical protein